MVRPVFTFLSCPIASPAALVVNMGLVESQRQAKAG